MIGLVLAGQLLVGLSASAGLGEAGPGLVVGAQQTIHQTQVRGWWDSAQKTATGQGWLVGGEGLTVRRGFLVGADVRVRSGGVWHKQTAWAMAGIERGGVQVFARLPVYESYQDHVLSVGGRARVGRIEVAPQLLHYHQPGGSPAWGVATDLLVQIGRTK